MVEQSGKYVAQAKKNFFFINVLFFTYVFQEDNVRITITYSYHFFYNIIHNTKK